VINDPTWPVEWKQISPFLGWQDYMATGQPDLALAFTKQMHDRTMISFMDKREGVLETDQMGRHIVDWMPDTPTSSGERDETVSLGEFTASKHHSVSNGFAAQGMNLLAQMMAAGGRTDNATQFASESTALVNGIQDKMWDAKAGSFCDGICSEVNGSSLVMTNMFFLSFGLIPQAGVDKAWHTVADWGLEKIGDYGAFWYFNALASGYYAPNYNTPASDDGTAVLTALTKCDRYSWCSGLRDDNLTMTRESWHQGTYSHQWGTSPIVGVVWGLMGVHVTSPGWATFTTKPKLGSLNHAEITVPTIRGYINVTAAPGSVEVNVPCNTMASLCLPRSAKDSALTNGKMFTTDTHSLVLDGKVVVATMSGGHMCASEPVSCGKAGAARVLISQLQK
jgi:alpha-L-rhamnosidase